MARISRKKEKTAAVVTIFAPGKMNKRGRSAIAAWLGRLAADFDLLGDEYTTGRYTARYLYR